MGGEEVEERGSGYICVWFNEDTIEEGSDEDMRKVFRRTGECWRHRSQYGGFGSAW